MKLSMQEVGVVFMSMNQDEKGEARKFPFTELGKAASISSKLDKCVKDGRIEDKKFDLDFTAEESVIIKEKTEGMSWGMGDAKHVQSLVTKLSK